MPQEKNPNRKKKIFTAKKARSVQEERGCPCQGILLKKRCQSNNRPALQRQPQKQHQSRLQYFQENKL